MSEYDPRSDLVQFARFLRRRAPLIVGCTILGGLAALATTWLRPSEWEASATVLVQADPLEQLVGLSDAFVAVGDPTLPGSAMQTQLELARQRPVAEAVRRRLRSSRTVESLLEDVRAEQDTTSSLMRIVARGRSADAAASLASNWAAAVVEDARRRQRSRIDRGIRFLRAVLDRNREPAAARGALTQQLTRLTALRATAAPPLRVVERAVPGGAPASPRRIVAASVGLMLGLVLGTGVALIQEMGAARALPGPIGPIGGPLAGRAQRAWRGIVARPRRRISAIRKRREARHPEADGAPVDGQRPSGE